MKRDETDKIIKIAQGCDSKECQEKYKKDQVRGECPTTAHEINLTKNERRCIMCGKTSKF